MGSSNQTVVGIKKVRKGMPEEEWDESMPLPGDIVESVSTVDQDDPLWAPAPGKGKSELRTQLRKLNREGMEMVWVRVRRGDAVLNLRARVAPDKRAKIHRKFTLRAARDDRHVAVLADITLDECSELQVINSEQRIGKPPRFCIIWNIWSHRRIIKFTPDIRRSDGLNGTSDEHKPEEMSRRVVNIDTTRFEKNKGINYDWKKKVGTYLPDRRSTVISSILFMPFSHERSVESTTTRCMAWFSAAVSCGAPLVFVNIQTEQTLNSGKNTTSSDVITRQLSWRELSWGRQQSPRKSTISETVQGIRLWFLPGIAEVLAILTIEPGETRFGMDIKQTQEGFICVSSVSKGSAADRAGLRKFCYEARQQGHLVVISRLEGNSITPSLVSSEGLIHCCDNAEIRYRLTNAIDRQEDVQLHLMAWSDLKCPPIPLNGPEILLPPATDHMELDVNQVKVPHSNREDVDPSFLKL